MIGALSPVVSWTLFLACVAVGVVVYVAIAGGRRYRRFEQKFDVSTQWMSATHSTTDGYIRLLPHVYDWQTRGDFE